MRNYQLFILELSPFPFSALGTRLCLPWTKDLFLHVLLNPFCLHFCDDNKVTKWKPYLSNKWRQGLCCRWLERVQVTVFDTSLLDNNGVNKRCHIETVGRQHFLSSRRMNGVFIIEEHFCENFSAEMWDLGISTMQFDIRQNTLMTTNGTR